MSDDAGLKVVVSADVQQLQVGADQAVQSLTDMEKELNAIGRAIDNTVAKGQDIGKLEDAYQALADKIKAAKAAAASPLPVPPAPPIPPPVPVPDDKPLLGSIEKQRVAFLDLGRVITGQGFSLRSLAANFTLMGPAVTIGAAALYGLYEILNKQTDAEKKAEEEAKKLAETLLDLKSATEVSDEAAGSEAGNIARVQALAAAIQDTNLSYKERKNALDELHETNKAYFGDLTLEASSLATLAGRINDYSNALISEAVVKGQVDAIAKVSSELQKQRGILDDLRKAKEAAAAQVDKFQPSATINLGQGSGAGETAQQEALQKVLDRATDKLAKQKDAVFQLEDQIVDYRRALDDAIQEQLKYKPLTVPSKTKSDLQDIVSVLKEVASIYADLAKPSKEPLFVQNQNSGIDLSSGQTSPIVQVIQAQIDAAKKKLVDPATSKDLAAAYQKLIAALNAKLQATLNPNLSSPLDQALANPEDAQKSIDQAESKIEKEFGEKGLQITVPASIKVAIKDSGFDKSDQEILLKKAEDDALHGLPIIKWTPKIQVIIDKQTISETLDKQLNDAINSSLKGAAASGLQGFGQAIGNAIAEGVNPIEAAGKSILSALGELMEDIGKSLIQYGVAKELLDTVLKVGIALPGVVAIGLGVAAEALGALVKSAGQSYHAFATGGIVTGPTLGLVGEAGPEAIFPLSQLNRFLAGQPGRGDQNINIRGRLSGNDLRLSLARTNKQQGLV